MALRGSIDDVPIVDVLQFVHLSGKSGTLALTSAAGPAWVEFNQGNIVFARGPQSRALGDVLVEIGGLSKDQVQRAADQQQRDPAHPPLGKLLLDQKVVTPDRLAECVRRQIQEAMMDIANWRSGDFQFDQGNVEVLDDIKVDVAEVLPLLKLNTQFLLLEAVRLFDEQQRDRELGGLPPAPEARKPPETREKTAPPKREKTGTPKPEATPSREKTIPPVRERTIPPKVERTPSPPPRREQTMPPGADLWGAGPEPRIVGEPALAPQGRSIEARPQAIAGGVLLVGFEKAVNASVTKALGGQGYKVLGHVPRREVDSQFLADRRWPPGMVLLWRIHATREKPEELAGALKLVERVSAKHPGWQVVALVSGNDSAAVARAYASGARAALPVDPQELVESAAVQDGLLAVVGQIWKESARAANAQAAELRAWLQAKRVTSEMQRALQKASIALELMRVAANSLERAILFLAKENELIGLGAFGLTLTGKPMAESLRGIAVNVQPDTPVSRCLGERTAFVGPTRELGLGTLFFELAGRPVMDRGVLIPLVGPSKAIGLLYGDNGQLNGPLRSIHAIEIAAAQAGIAYENVLLRMRLDGKTPKAEEPEVG